MTAERNSTRCFICGHSNSNILEVHHAVPQRLGGSDIEENTYSLCGSCHNAVEEIYDDGFYQRLGVAVDGDEGEFSRQHQTGEVLEPQDSQGRKIPPNSDHIEVEEYWRVNVTISQVEAIAEGNYDHADEWRWSFGPDHVSLVEKYAESILEKYERGRKASISLAEDRENKEVETLLEKGDPPLKFDVEPEDLAADPMIVVSNAERSWEESEKPQWIKGQSNIDGQNRGPPLSVQHQWERENYDHYRLHCGYCHRAYSKYQHTDLARHLRLQHGIENPYEEKDTTYGDRPDIGQRIFDRGGGDD
jgi:hypothetical protein